MKSLLSLGLFITLTSICFAQENSSKLTEADQLAIAVQKTCPVTGAELGSMGEPVKIKAGEQIAFLCCKACQGKKISAEHWTTIQERLAKAQGLCPIMEKPVDSSMKSTVVNGQQIFVCCPPCIPKIEADPRASIEKVTAAYTKFIAAEKQAASDAIHVKAQKICPVTGKKLGSMGDPVKVKVGKDEHAFLCCKGCVGKKMDATHWKTIQTNLATAQQLCPVMEQPVDLRWSRPSSKGGKSLFAARPASRRLNQALTNLSPSLIPRYSSTSDRTNRHRPNCSKAQSSIMHAKQSLGSVRWR